MPKPQHEMRYFRADHKTNAEDMFCAKMEYTNLGQVNQDVEPVVVIRASHPGAIGMVNMMIEVARDTDYPATAIHELTRVRDGMREWQRQYGTIAPPEEYGGQIVDVGLPKQQDDQEEQVAETVRRKPGRPKKNVD